MPRKRNKLQQRRSDSKKKKKLDHKNYLDKQAVLQRYTQYMINEDLQLMRMNAHKEGNDEPTNDNE